jgi:polyisoprenoid-binding protein YceI
MKFCLMGLALAAAPLAAWGAPETMQLSAGNMLAQTHSHAMFMSVTGTYRQISGVLNFDPDAKTCDIDASFVVESLELPNQLIRSQTMNAGFLDPQDFPTNEYKGTCSGDTLTGTLSMHGQTHPFNMTISYRTTNGVVTGIHTDGTLNRYDWGISGNGMTVGKMIEVTNDISLDGKPPVSQ